MLAIQDVGKQVLSGNPNPFYIFIGDAYGIKDKYISFLKSHYGHFQEADSMEEVIKLIGRKSLLPVPNKVYVVRYDDSFIKSLGKDSTSEINALCKKIRGTIVLIVENSKHGEKCNKYLPDYTVSFNGVSKLFISKYLTSDFPGLDSELITKVSSVCSEYKLASNLCISLTYLVTSKQNSLTTQDLLKHLSYTPATSDDPIRYGVAARNYGYLIKALDEYSLSYESLFYTILATLLDLEKQISKPNPKSPYATYQKCWNANDIYYAFDHTYSELEKSRDLADYDIYSGLVYLFSLIAVSPIPTKELLTWN